MPFLNNSCSQIDATQISVKIKVSIVTDQGNTVELFLYVFNTIAKKSPVSLIASYQINIVTTNEWSTLIYDNTISDMDNT